MSHEPDATSEPAPRHTWELVAPKKSTRPGSHWGGIGSLCLHAVMVILCLLWPQRALDVSAHEPPVYEIDLVSLVGEPSALPGATEQGDEDEDETESLRPQEEILISPVKDDELAQELNNATQVVHPADSIFFGDGMLKQGNEIRLSLRAIATYDFTEDDYVGHYRFRNEDRYVSILDGRAQYGKLILYDSRTGMVRALTEVSRFIYTYAETTFGEEPVAGSITFMPKKPEPYSGVITPSKLLWISNEAAAKVGFEVEFNEERVQVESGDATLEAALVMLPSNDPQAAVVFAPEPGCRPQNANLRFARFLALHDMAVLVMDMRGCGESTTGASGRDWQDAGPDVAARDLLAAVQTLRGIPGIDPDRVGIWANDNGASAAVHAAALGGPAFVVAGSAAWQDAVPETPSRRELAAVQVPLLWILAGPDPAEDWEDFLDDLSRAPQSEAVLLPDQDAFAEPVGSDELRESVWLRDLSSAYADIALPWIREH